MKKGSAKRVSSLPSNAEFNLGGLYHALRIATVRSSDSLWVPFDKEGKCCKVIHSPTQPQYVETICCLLYTNDELNTSLRIDPSRASRLVSNTAHVPDYFTNKFLADNIFETFSLNVRDRFLSRFTNFITGHTGWTDNFAFAFAHKDKSCSPFKKRVHDPSAPYDAYDESDDTEENAKSGFLKGVGR